MSPISKEKEERKKRRMSYKFINKRRGTRSEEACGGGGGGSKIKISKKRALLSRDQMKIRWVNRSRDHVFWETGVRLYCRK